MDIRHVPAAVIILGLALMLLSVVWPSSMPALSGWSDEKAQQYTKAAATLHKLVYEHADAEAAGQPLDPAQLQTAKQRYEQQRGMLDAARSRKRNIPLLFRWTGVFFALLGSAGHFTLMVVMSDK